VSPLDRLPGAAQPSGSALIAVRRNTRARSAFRRIPQRAHRDDFEVDNDSRRTVETIAITAHLKPGAEAEAQALIEEGPPFDLVDPGLIRHTVYLSADEVVFVFEGHEVEWVVDAIATDPFRWQTTAALDRWRRLIQGPARIARPAFDWRRDERDVAADAERGNR
jgi:Rad3-related DNA helicase